MWHANSVDRDALNRNVALGILGQCGCGYLDIMNSAENREQRIQVVLALLHFIEIDRCVRNDDIWLAVKDDFLHTLRQLVSTLAKPGIRFIGIELR